MSKRSTIWTQDELHQSPKRRLVSKVYKVVTGNIQGTAARPIPLPFVDDINDMTFRENPIIHTKSESLNFGAENLFTDLERSSTIPLPTSSYKPLTLSAFTFPDSIENISDSTDSESASDSETSEDELATDSTCQSGGRSNKNKNREIIACSNYYKQRINQMERQQQIRRERWKKKLENMEKLLNILKSK